MRSDSLGLFLNFFLGRHRLPTDAGDAGQAVEARREPDHGALPHAAVDHRRPIRQRTVDAADGVPDEPVDLPRAAATG